MEAGDEEDEDDEDGGEDEQGFFADEVADIWLAVVGCEDDDCVPYFKGAGIEDHCFVIGDGEDAAALVFYFEILDAGLFALDSEDFGFESGLRFSGASGVLDGCCED